MVRLFLVLALTLPAACSVFGSDEEEAAPQAAATVEQIVQPVESVRGIEIGRARDGVVITAYGIAPGLGYSAPRLRERRNGRLGTDGYLDFDFVADAPDRGFALPKGEPQARILRADRLISIEVLRGAAGIRVHGASGGQQIAF